ncbi:MAG TPA: hypothetical protein VJT33_03710 [bacterium]|nr:hypothetical protein [bacterium]
MTVPLVLSAPPEYLAAINNRLEALARDRFVPRLWARDPTLWTADPAGQAAVRAGLGWLRAPKDMAEAVSDLDRFAADLRQDGYRQVLHMGMGGSSLAPLVFERTFPAEDGLRLSVLDTTDPATILAADRWAAGAPTLYIVASKSGTTAEPLAFGEYFYAKRQAVASEAAGRDFAVVTDAGTPLANQAQQRRYRRVFTNAPDVGGRYSALTYFGLVPAVLAGIDISGVLDRARRMAAACGPEVSPAQNPGVQLGAVMGELARRGRDKVTFIVSESVATLGTWLEQLLAESTGKNGTGLLPVAGEALGGPGDYGVDRLFVYVRRRGETGGAIEDGIRALRDAMHPIVTVEMDDTLDVGHEFFRWEIATATAGAILGINAFDQPNVQESKDITNRLLETVRRDGRLAEPPPTQTDGPLALYADGAGGSLADALARFLRARRPGDYLAILAYLTESVETERTLQAVRLQVRDSTRLATTLGYGPRYLHSTGQYHKGGPPTGLFLIITADDAEDAPVPGQPYTFGVFKRAQALGDLEALRSHDRRVVRVHLRGPVDAALVRLGEVTAAALAAGGSAVS